jgi:hypothetical protein
LNAASPLLHTHLATLPLHRCCLLLLVLLFLVLLTENEFFASCYCGNTPGCKVLRVRSHSGRVRWNKRSKIVASRHAEALPSLPLHT